MTTTRKIGFAQDAKTYGEVRKAMPLKMRLLGALGDILDRCIRAGDAPIFPKDAPLHQPNCGVVAMCMFTDRAYEEVAPILGRERSRSWTGTTYHRDYAPCIAELGFTVTIDGNGHGGSAKRETLGQLADSTEGKAGRIFATVRGHAICIWDGLIFDQSWPAGATPAEHPMSGYQITYTMRRA